MEKNKNKEKYIKIRGMETEATKEDLKKNNFDDFIQERFPTSLRKTGKRKWKSLFMVE